MKLLDNFSETHLLFSYDIDLLFIDDSGNLNSKQTTYSKMKLPLFKHCYLDYKFQSFLGILLTPYEQTLKHVVKLSGVNDLYSLCSGIIITSQFNSYYADIIIYGLNTILPRFTVDNGIMYVDNIELNKEIFDRIVSIVLVATEHKKLHELAIKDPALQAMEDKIARIKKQNNNNKNALDSSFTQSYMILNYEFGYSSEQILNMTMYAITMILKYTGKSINYKVSLIGAGNGLSKKIHFITDKGK